MKSLDILTTKSGKEITLESFAEVCVANKRGLEAVFSYRKWKTLQAVKSLRVEHEKIEAENERRANRQKQITELRAKIEAKKEIKMVA